MWSRLLEDQEISTVALEVPQSVRRESNLDIETVRDEVHRRDVSLVATPFYSFSTQDVLDLLKRKIYNID